MLELMGRFVKSFANALQGIAYLFKSQFNARVQIIIAVFVIIAGFFFGINKFEWISILLCLAMVLSLEGINTSLETLLNKVHPGFDTEIGKSKDVAAGAVLIASFVAAIIGIIIFAPRLWDLFIN